jgi:hypothetical protein
MKQIIVTLFSAILISSWTCSKDDSIAPIKKESTNCTTVTVTQQGLGCNLWGILLNGKVYPAMNLPDQYKKEGNTICVVYEIFEDMRDCACCGGTWANILSIDK